MEWKDGIAGERKPGGRREERRGGEGEATWSGGLDSVARECVSLARLPQPVLHCRGRRWASRLALRRRPSQSAFQNGTAPRKWVSLALSLSDQYGKVPVAK